MQAQEKKEELGNIISVAEEQNIRLSLERRLPLKL